MLSKEELNRIETKRKESVLFWMPQLVAALGISEEELNNTGLSCADFPYAGIRIAFEDGSIVQFRYAFAVEKNKSDTAVRLVGVFTEHCGYHEYYLMPEEQVVTPTLIQY